MVQMTGARFLADTLAGYGVSHVFMVPAVLRRTMAEMERRTSIKNIHTHGEISAAYMADGYARASGKPGVCMAQQTGALNLAAGIRDAWLASTPLIAMTGGSRPSSRFRGLYQEVEDLPTFTPYTKWNASVEDVERFPDMVRQAFREATTGRPGPVHLQFQGQEGELDQHEGDMEVVLEEAFAVIPPFRPQPDGDAVRNTIDLIESAERPIIVVGGGVRSSGAGEALFRFARAVNIPIACSASGRDCVPDNDPLSVGVVGTYSRESANRAVHESDLVIVLGSKMGSMVSNFWRLPVPGTKVVQVDLDPAILGRNYPAEVSILSDARLALEALATAAGGFNKRANDAWVKSAQEYAENWRQTRAEQRDSDAVPIRPERICGELSDHLPDDAILVVDTGHAGMWMAGMYDQTSMTRSYIRSAGHLGWAFSASLGAKCACPDRPVVCFTGDLGMWYHIGEIETAVRWNINSVTIVNNNHSGNQSMRGFSLAYEGKPTERSRELWVHKEVNFARIAEEIGALGIRVENPKDFRPALDQALNTDRPVVLDVVTDIDAVAPLAWDADGWVQSY